MNRSSLGEDRGMLFVFDQSSNYSFRMKDTLIPLDMIRLDENYKIVYIHKNVLPCVTDACPLYASGMPARYVLEVNGGAASKFGLQIGQTMTFKN